MEKHPAGHPQGPILTVCAGVPGTQERASPGRSPMRLAGCWAPSENAQRAAAEAATSQVLHAEGLRKGGRKGQDNGPFVSMETAPQGEGLKERELPLHLQSELGKWAFSWLGSHPPTPTPGLPCQLFTMATFPPNKRCTWQSDWCWGAREPSGSRTGGHHPSLTGHRPGPGLESWDHGVHLPELLPAASVVVEGKVGESVLCRTWHTDVPEKCFLAKWRYSTGTPCPKSTEPPRPVLSRRSTD